MRQFDVFVMILKRILIGVSIGALLGLMLVHLRPYHDRPNPFLTLKIGDTIKGQNCRHWDYAPDNIELYTCRWEWGQAYVRIEDGRVRALSYMVIVPVSEGDLVAWYGAHVPPHYPDKPGLFGRVKWVYFNGA